MSGKLKGFWVILLCDDANRVGASKVIDAVGANGGNVVLYFGKNKCLDEVVAQASIPIPEGMRGCVVVMGETSAFQVSEDGEIITRTGHVLAHFLQSELGYPALVVEDSLWGLNWSEFNQKLIQALEQLFP